MRSITSSLAVPVATLTLGACALVTSFDVPEGTSTSATGGASASSGTTGSTTTTTTTTSSTTSSGTGGSAPNPFVLAFDIGTTASGMPLETYVSTVIEGPNDALWFAGRYKGSASLGALPSSANGDYFIGHVAADGTGLQVFALGLAATTPYDHIALAWNGASEMWFATAHYDGAAGVAELGYFDATSAAPSPKVVGTCTSANILQSPGLAVRVPSPGAPTDVAFGFSTNAGDVACSFPTGSDATACVSQMYASPSFAQPDTLLFYARRSAGTCHARTIREESGPGSIQSVPRLAIDPSTGRLILVGRYTGELFGASGLATLDPSNINVGNEYVVELVPNGATLDVGPYWDLGAYADPGGAAPVLAPGGGWQVAGTAAPFGPSTFVADPTKTFQGEVAGYVFRPLPSPAVALWTATPSRSSISGMRAYGDKSLVFGNVANVVPFSTGQLAAPCHVQQSGACFSGFWAILDPSFGLVSGKAYGDGSGSASVANEPRYQILGGFLTKAGRVAIGGVFGGEDAGAMVLGGMPLQSSAGQRMLFLAALDPTAP